MACVSEIEGGERDEGRSRQDLIQRERVWEMKVKKQQADDNTLVKLHKLIDETADIFYVPGEPLPATNLVQHRINLIDDIPINIRQYPI